MIVQLLLEKLLVEFFIAFLNSHHETKKLIDQ